MNNRSEDKPLLESDALASKEQAQPQQAQDYFFLMPKDVQKYLLGFCTLQDVKRMAQVNKMFHTLINAANYQQIFETRFDIISSIDDRGVEDRSTSAYVKGTYSQLRDFFLERKQNREALRVPQTPASCCYSKCEADTLMGVGAQTGAYSITGTLIGIGFGIYALVKQAAAVPLMLAGGATGCCCLMSAGAVTCMCVGCRLHQNKKDERTATEARAIGQPSVAMLHGAMFSLQPSVQHDEDTPPRLGMN